METVIYSLYLSKLEQLQQFERRMTTPPFAVMLAIAFSLHIIAMLVIGYLMPKPTAIPVAVRELTLHLGGGKELASKIDEKNMAQRMADAVQGLTKPTPAPTPKEIAPEAITSTAKPAIKKHKPSPSTRVMASAPKTIKVDEALEKHAKKSTQSAEIAGISPPSSASTTGGTSDARFIRRHCPVIEFGIVGQTMHKTDERVKVEDLTRLTEIYAEVLKVWFI